MSTLCSEAIVEFYKNLEVPDNLPSGIEALYPFDENAVSRINKEFYQSFYADSNKRSYLIGINPGRLGAGVTGIPFTDPIRLKNELKIENNFQQKSELSSKFIYDVIESFGGPHAFFGSFYFTSVSPIGFIKEGKNLNYYDDKALEKSIENYVIENFNKQLRSIPTNRKIAFCLGMGKNFSYLKKLNEKHRLFENILPLPHPRWVMQYRLKSKKEFILAYQQNLLLAIT